MSAIDFEITSRLGPLMLMFAQQHGLDLKQLTTKFGLPESIPMQGRRIGELVTSLSALRGLIDELGVQLKDEHVGLSLSAAIPRGSYGVGELLVDAAPTLRRAFENFVRFSAIMAPNQTFVFRVKDGVAELHNNVTRSVSAFNRHLNEYSTAIQFREFRRLAPTSRVASVWFVHPAPNDVEPLKRFFETETLIFSQPTNGFAVSADSLDQPSEHGDEALFEFLEQHAISALASRPKMDALLEQLRAFLQESMRDGEPTVEKMAERMSMSARTLQRRLTDLGTTFQDVLDDVRFDAARAYLKDESLDVSEVAYLLGYSEARAFERAFKRWSKMTPKDWRKSSFTSNGRL